MTATVKLLDQDEGSSSYRRAIQSRQFEKIYNAFIEMGLSMTESYRQVITIEDKENFITGTRVHISYKGRLPSSSEKYAVIQVFFGNNGQETVGFVLKHDMLFTQLTTDNSIEQGEEGFLKEEWSGSVWLQEREFEPEGILS